MQNLQFNLYDLSHFAGSGSGTIIPDTDPGKSSGSMGIRIRIHNTEKRAPGSGSAWIESAWIESAWIESAWIELRLQEIPRS